MAYLNDDQRRRAVEAMREYLAAPHQESGKPLVDFYTGLDAERARLIDDELKPLVESYIAGQTPLAEFKSTVDGINKRHELWGFKGIKGQMFFNMLVNQCDNPAEVDQEVKAAIAVPVNDDMARSRIRTLASFTRRAGEQYLDGGGSKAGRVKVSSVPFFISYFWQIQNRDAWPVYYTNSVNVMSDLNIWQPGEDLADNYVDFKAIHQELAGVFAEASGRKFSLYDIEHAFWFKGANPYEMTKGAAKIVPLPVAEEKALPDETVGLERLPESYVPPVVAILPRMARNEPSLGEAAKASGTRLERAFEKSIHAAFTILGYDAKLLGQGQGRVPDGRAIDFDDSYGVLWDAKVRANGYSIGTDDRTIREYITTQSRELKKRHHLRNIYYVVISSCFAEDYDDVIRSLKMETDTSEVCLLEAAALAAMVEAKLRDPQQVTLGPDGLQRLFSVSGIMTEAVVRSTLA